MMRTSIQSISYSLYNLIFSLSERCGDDLALTTGEYFPLFRRSSEGDFVLAAEATPYERLVAFSGLHNRLSWGAGEEMPLL
jgi:hypothetical protein